MRKPINLKNMIEVGYVKKTHGVQGELHIVVDEGLYETIDQLTYLFFEIDGLPVPFFIENFSTIGDGFAHVKFKNLDTKENANRYIGTKLLIGHQELEIDLSNVNTTLIIGFTIVDTKLGEIGKVVEVNDFGGNIVLSVNYSNQEVMIPFNEELIVSLNMETQTIEMDCPEGLFNLSDN